MNIIQIQDNLKNLPDQALQKELLQPTGTAPGFLVLTELNRRKQMRSAYDAQKQQPQQSMAEEFAQGLGSAEVGAYPDAVRGSMAPPPTQTPMAAGASPQGEMPQMPQSSPMAEQQPQAFADGGRVEMAAPAEGATMASGKKDEGPAYWTDFMTGKRKDSAGLGMFAGPLMAPITNIIEGRSFGDILKSMSPAATALNAVGVKFGGGGPVKFGGGGDVLRRRQQEWLNQYNQPGPVAFVEPESPVPLTFAERYRRAMSVPSKDLSGIAAETIRNIKANVPPEYRDEFVGDSTMLDPEVSSRDAKNPLWRVRRGTSEVARPGPQDYPPDPNGFAPRPFDPPLSQEPPPVGSGEFNRGQGLAQPPLPEFGGADAQGIAGLLDPFTGGGPRPQSGGDRVSGGFAGVSSGGVSGGAGGGGSRRGVGGALNIGGEGLADYVNEVRSLQMPDRFGEMEKRNQEDRDKLLSGVEGDKGMALLTAGLGIMGGDSPYAAVNIGRGAQAGVKYWNDAQKELRLAQQAIRQAENQITIARANRDEKQLETGMKLYATAQERQQQALNRANSAGIAASDRAQRAELARLQYESEDKNRTENREFNRLKLESETKNREEIREQSRISEYGALSQKFSSTAMAAETKLAALEANILTASPEAKAQIEAARREVEGIRQQADYYSAMHRRAVDERDIRSGNLAVAGEKEGYDAKGNKMKNGQRFIRADGQKGTWKE